MQDVCEARLVQVGRRLYSRSRPVDVPVLFKGRLVQVRGGVQAQTRRRSYHAGLQPSAEGDVWVLPKSRVVQVRR